MPELKTSTKTVRLSPDVYRAIQLYRATQGNDNELLTNELIVDKACRALLAEQLASLKQAA